MNGDHPAVRDLVRRIPHRSKQISLRQISNGYVVGHYGVREHYCKDLNEVFEYLKKVFGCKE